MIYQVLKILMILYMKINGSSIIIIYILGISMLIHHLYIYALKIY
jgi:hypothetical protein